MTDQPRQPAGSPEGGQFTSAVGREASSLPPEWEVLPDNVVTVRGGLGESNDSVRIIDLDVLDDRIQEDWVFPILLADAQVLREHGHDYDAQRLEEHIAWHGIEITDAMRAEAEESHQRYVERGRRQFAVVEGGLVQYESPGVTVIDMDVVDSTAPDNSDVEYAREAAATAESVGMPIHARELRDWADHTEAELLARQDS